MNKYRNQLCSYYNTYKLGSDTISPYAKAEAVIEANRKLWELDSDESTYAGMILNIRGNSFCNIMNIHNYWNYVRQTNKKAC